VVIPPSNFLYIFFHILICVLYNLTNYLPQEGHLLRERRGEHPVGKICDATLFISPVFTTPSEPRQKIVM
jgi:hypothetical protein